jgi:hypothetical protein
MLLLSVANKLTMLIVVMLSVIMLNVMAPHFFLEYGSLLSTLAWSNVSGSGQEPTLKAEFTNLNVLSNDWLFHAI